MTLIQTLKIKLLTPTAKIPTQAHKGDIYDVYADEDKLITDIPSLVSTGISLQIPEGFHVKIYNRSSNPLKFGLILSNSVGIVDSLYTGEIKGIFHCQPHIENEQRTTEHIIKKGDKIMQIEVCPVYEINFEKVEELAETERGSKGFGSSGK